MFHQISSGDSYCPGSGKITGTMSIPKLPSGSGRSPRRSITGVPAAEGDSLGSIAQRRDS
jgi:hypothetical protein